MGKDAGRGVVTASPVLKKLGRGSPSCSLGKASAGRPGATAEVPRGAQLTCKFGGDGGSTNEVTVGRGCRPESGKGRALGGVGGSVRVADVAAVADTSLVAVVVFLCRCTLYRPPLNFPRVERSGRTPLARVPVGHVG